MSDLTTEQPLTAPASPTSRARTTTGGLHGMIGSRSFVACVLLMGSLTVAYEVTIRAKGTHLHKDPVYLRAPLSQLDATRLGPYRLAQATDLKPEILDGLGTREYIDWMMEDTSVERGSPDRWIHLFVTYYTDVPGQVPHVPEECFTGGGFKHSTEEIVDVPVPDLGETVPVKMLVFERSGLLGSERRVVLYTFHTNGQFAPERQVVRNILNSPASRSAYFSKVEIGFGNAEAPLSPDKALEAGRRFLAKVLPLLVKEHWPDWKSVEAQGAAAASRPASGSR